jgi:hypothetical protein
MVGHTHEANGGALSVSRLTQRARLRFPDAEPYKMINEAHGIDGMPVREVLTHQFMDRAIGATVEGRTDTGKNYLEHRMAERPI